MLRKLITPEQQRISINLPASYIGKKVEVIAFTVDDTSEESLVTDKAVTYYASEKSLANDWSTHEEDIAWQNL